MNSSPAILDSTGCNPGIHRSQQRARGSAVRVLFCVLGLLVSAPGVAVGPDRHPHEDIRAAAVAAARQAAGEVAGDAAFEADRPDPRLRLAACTVPLESQPAGNGRPLSGRLLVEVRCASAPWRLYLPVRATVIRPVVVAARPLSRDTILAADDVRLAERDVTGLARGYFGDLDGAVGRRLKRAVGEGTALTPALVDEAVLVRRGQQVLIETRAGGFAVTMAGVARADGRLGQVIPVENGSSGRRLEAVVRSARSVEVLFR